MADVIPLFPTPKYVVLQVSFMGKPGGRTEKAIRRAIGKAGNDQVPGDCWARSSRDSILWTRVRETDAKRIEDRIVATLAGRGGPMRVGGKPVDDWLAALDRWEADLRRRAAS